MVEKYELSNDEVKTFLDKIKKRIKNIHYFFV